MIDELILGILGPVKFNLVVRSLETLHSYGANDVYPIIETTVSDDTELDNTGRRLVIYSILKENLEELLLRQGVTLYDETPLEIYELAARCLKETTEGYDPDHILNSINMEVSDEQSAMDIFLKLLQLLYDVDPMEYVDHLHYVDDDMIRNIHRILSEKVIPEIQTVDIERKERYLKFLEGRRTGLVFSLIESGLSIGQLDASALIPYLEETASELSDTTLAFEIASLILISIDDVSDDLIHTLSGAFRDNESAAMSVRTKTSKMLETFR